MTFAAPPRAVVVDASVAVEVLTANPLWLDQWTHWLVEQTVLLSPTHFTAEVANALLRGQRLPGSRVRALLDRLAASGLETADRGLAGVLEAIDLAEAHGLTIYDALYLQLALDIDGELATLDKDLRRAAIAEDVQVTD
jgi:predicted nucleic acid-binding protein